MQTPEKFASLFQRRKPKLYSCRTMLRLNVLVKRYGWATEQITELTTGLMMTFSWGGQFQKSTRVRRHLSIALISIMKKTLACLIFQLIAMVTWIARHTVSHVYFLFKYFKISSRIGRPQAQLPLYVTAASRFSQIIYSLTDCIKMFSFFIVPDLLYVVKRSLIDLLALDPDNPRIKNSFLKFDHQGGLHGF